MISVTTAASNIEITIVAIITTHAPFGANSFQFVIPEGTWLSFAEWCFLYTGVPTGK